MDLIENELERIRSSRAEESDQSNRFYLAGTALALTIPSVCSKYLYKKDVPGYTERESERYPKWYNTYVDFTDHLDGKECYAFRCSLLHNGDDDDIPEQSVLKKANDGAYQNYKYHFYIPFSADKYELSYETLEGKDERTFCAGALIFQILEGYRRFKSNYPDFVYPLEKK